MDFTSLIIQLVSGALGGNIAGALFKNLSLGTTGNSIAGIIGGPLGAMLLSQLGLGGIVLMLLVGFIKKAMAK